MKKQIAPLVVRGIFILTGIGLIGGAAYWQGYVDGTNLIKDTMEIKERLDKEAKQD